LDWSSTPSVNENYRTAYDYIRSQLEILLRDFKK